MRSRGVNGHLPGLLNFLKQKIKNALRHLPVGIMIELLLNLKG